MQARPLRTRSRSPRAADARGDARRSVSSLVSRSACAMPPPKRRVTRPAPRAAAADISIAPVPPADAPLKCVHAARRYRGLTGAAPVASPGAFVIQATARIFGGTQGASSFTSLSSNCRHELMVFKRPFRNSSITRCFTSVLCLPSTRSARRCMLPDSDPEPVTVIHAFLRPRGHAALQC